jgi:hypothetical protein
LLPWLLPPILHPSFPEALDKMIKTQVTKGIVLHIRIDCHVCALLSMTGTGWYIQNRRTSLSSLPCKSHLRRCLLSANNDMAWGPSEERNHSGGGGSRRGHDNHCRHVTSCHEHDLTSIPVPTKFLTYSVTSRPVHRWLQIMTSPRDSWHLTL